VVEEQVVGAVDPLNIADAVTRPHSSCCLQIHSTFTFDVERRGVDLTTQLPPEVVM
jgi:hypothetical protein